MSDEIKASEDAGDKALANVTNIQDAPPKEDKSVVDLYMNIKLVFEAAPNPSKFSKLAPFEKSIKFISSHDGIRVPIEIAPNKECRYVSEDYCIDMILRYANFMMYKSKMTHASATACYKFIKSSVDVFEEEIHPVAPLSKDIYTWRKLPFDLSDGEYPTFQEMLSRMDTPISVMAWIGSLFIKESDQQQYLWIHGNGQDGKGRLAHFLRTAFGQAYRSEQVPDQGGRRFWTSGLLGKRLICFTDCEEFGFPSTGYFKSLTGGDSQRIEPKGKQAYDAEIECKFLFLSNDSPTVSGAKAEMRRALYVEMEPAVDNILPAPVYNKKLWDEAPHFLYKCIEVYKRCCPHHGAIPLTARAKESLANLVSDGEDYWRAVLARGGLAFDDTKYSDDTKSSDMSYVAPTRIQTICKEERMNTTTRNAFIKWLKHSGKGKRKVRVGNTFEWRYIGIAEIPCDM